MSETAFTPELTLRSAVRHAAWFSVEHVLQNATRPKSQWDSANHARGHKKCAYDVINSWHFFRAICGQINIVYPNQKRLYRQSANIFHISGLPQDRNSKQQKKLRHTWRHLQPFPRLYLVHYERFTLQQASTCGTTRRLALRCGAGLRLLPQLCERLSTNVLLIVTWVIFVPLQVQIVRLVCKKHRLSYASVYRIDAARTRARPLCCAAYMIEQTSANQASSSSSNRWTLPLDGRSTVPPPPVGSLLGHLRVNYSVATSIRDPAIRCSTQNNPRHELSSRFRSAV